MPRLLSRRLGTGLAVGAVSLALLAPAGASAHGTGRHHQLAAHLVTGGLNNPRGIDVGRDGRVYVAEAGTGKVLTIKGGTVRALISGLPTAVSPEGETTGPVNVAVSSLFGRTRVVAAIGAGPQTVDARFDSVVRIRSGNASVLADIQAYRNAHPDTTDLDQPPNPTDSNAYGLAALPFGRTLVTDAAGNELDLIGANGRIQTVAKFPNQVVSTSHLPPGEVPAGVTELPAEAVPTSVAVGPDGWWYVGELKGFPFTPGTSRIWRIAPWARNVVCDPAAKRGPCTIYADGLTSVTGMAFGPDRSLYVVEIVKDGVLNLFSGGDTTGALIRIRHGKRTELVPGRLHAPGDVAVARNGRIYVTNQSVSPTSGQVLVIR
ncbi:MAG TPA: ScyD/ScyE family protein [Candidatus Limnocylindrales bacterium]